MEKKKEYQHYTSCDLGWYMRDMGVTRLKQAFDRITLVTMRMEIVERLKSYCVDSVGADWLETRVKACLDTGDHLGDDLAEYYLLGGRSEKFYKEIARAFNFVAETYFPLLQGSNWYGSRALRIIQALASAVEWNAKLYWISGQCMHTYAEYILRNFFSRSTGGDSVYGSGEWQMLEALMEIIVKARDTSLLPLITSLMEKYKHPSTFPSPTRCFGLEGIRHKAHSEFFWSAVEFLNQFERQFGLDKIRWEHWSKGISIMVDSDGPYQHRLIVDLNKMPWMVEDAKWHAQYEVEGDPNHSDKEVIVSGGEQGVGISVFKTCSYKFRIWFDLNNGKELKKFFVNFIAGRPHFIC